MPQGFPQVTHGIRVGFTPSRGLELPSNDSRAARNETGNYLALLPILDLNLEMRQSALPHGLCSELSI